MLANLGIDKPKQYKKAEVRVKESIESYNILKGKYEHFLLTNEAEKLVDLFDK